MTIPLPPANRLTSRAVERIASGDSMLRTDWTRDGQPSRSWTKLTRIDTRVGLDIEPHLDPIPAEPFRLWEAVSA